jgi:hypothetical protein
MSSTADRTFGRCADFRRCNGQYDPHPRPLSRVRERGGAQRRGEGVPARQEAVGVIHRTHFLSALKRAGEGGLNRTPVLSQCGKAERAHAFSVGPETRWGQAALLVRSRRSFQRHQTTPWSRMRYRQSNRTYEITPAQERVLRCVSDKGVATHTATRFVVCAPPAAAVCWFRELPLKGGTDGLDHAH